MNRIKTLSLPLISALVASPVTTVSAQVALELSSQKTYRQNKQAMNFKGGSFNINLSDGSVSSVAGCDFIQYYPPGYFIGICSQGTTAFLTSGEVNGANIANPYLLVTTLTPAQAIEPLQPDLVFLRAAPASGLPRPLGNFKDNSSALYFNLHNNASIQEYVLTRYNSTFPYNQRQRAKFESEIVPGVYHYSFPRLGRPEQPAPITAVIYPMPEGLAERNNKEEGLEFTQVNNNRWTKEGFLELSYIKPNTFRWKQLSPSVVFPAVDSLYFSWKVMSDPSNPESATDLIDNYTGRQQAVFPGFSNEGDARIQLVNPFTTRITTPPIFPGGTTAVVELQVQRAFQTGGVTYDFSERKFQIPVIVINRYTEYQETVLRRSRDTGLLGDTDRDGYNNLNEWILDSSASDPTSVPVAPITVDNPAVYDLDFFTFFGRIRLVRPQYFGFTVNKKLATKPGVVYTLQRSRDRGRTWRRFVTDDNWTVRTVRYAPGIGSLKQNSPTRVEIQVESKVTDAATLNQIQPPGTQSDRYRVKITLRKKKN